MAYFGPEPSYGSLSMSDEWYGRLRLYQSRGLEWLTKRRMVETWRDLSEVCSKIVHTVSCHMKSRPESRVHIFPVGPNASIHSMRHKIIWKFGSCDAGSISNLGKFFKLRDNKANSELIIDLNWENAFQRTGCRKMPQRRSQISYHFENELL